jgi:hypothetical protein
MRRNRAAHSAEACYCHIVGHSGLSINPRSGSNIALHKSERRFRVKHLLVAGNRFTSGTVEIRGTGGSSESFATIAAPLPFRDAIQLVQSSSDRR